ncbi:polysaccharide biosynthesis/export family protein [Gemmobacter denitrificans]|uniref:Polysaccharide biosynthesis/export family protein n=1 Tax=Gemmobacter denitrificans TaxID=3123040 RepID=A0ABU8BWQ9_9RHOB
MPFNTGKLLLLTAGLSLLSACGDLPGGGPSAAQVLKGADEENASFAVEFVTRDSLQRLKQWPRKGGPAVAGWISRERGPASQLVEPGDTLDLAIWDNGESSLLTQSGQKVVDLKAIRVNSAGEVFLPYVDRVHIAKMTPDAARDAIQQEFADIIPTAQVQLSHTPGRQSSVDLVSGVAKPGNYPMPDRDMTVLALLALGGGISDGLKNPQVRLMRGGKLYGISAEKLLASPQFDTTLRGGDKVFVAEDDRYFLALGAAKTEAQIRFPQDNLNALDAASLAGGLNDARANPKGVLVLRDYDSRHLRADGTGPTKERTIFAIDLTTADGLFSAGEFRIEDRDLVLVTESSINKTDTVLGIIGQSLGLARRTTQIVE